MSSSVDKKEIQVVTYLEAFILGMVFIFILYILYPKDTLYKQVLSEKNNYDLTAVYLENMVRLDPTNKELILALVKTSIRDGEVDLALKMINILSKDKSSDNQKEILKYKFSILKLKYFSTNEKQFQEKILKEMKTLLNNLIKDKIYNDEDIEFWYESSKEFSLNHSALYFLQILVKKSKKQSLYEECFYISDSIKDEKIHSECLIKLQKLDSKWIKKAYYIAINKNDKKQIFSILTEMSRKSIYWKEELAKFYLSEKNYQKSSDLYMQIFKKVSKYEKKKKYIIKAIEALRYANMLDEASSLAKKYEQNYYKDKNMSSYIIKLYLNASKLEDAKRVSIKRLKYMD